ncbi:hypothetical protein VTP01DRAFT_8750 [Rhizomucor pusillus]|uniref:uncharacterized protein n=1 Tax=Rhizomucor pusillus TaxID=4840 RepID=UPI0037430963
MPKIGSSLTAPYALNSFTAPSQLSAKFDGSPVIGFTDITFRSSTKSSWNAIQQVYMSLLLSHDYSKLSLLVSPPLQRQMLWYGSAKENLV